MKKTLAIMLAVLLCIGMLSGCTKKEETTSNGETSQKTETSEQAETTEPGGPESWKTVSDIDGLEGLYVNERKHFENTFVYAFTYEDVIYRAILELTDEQSDALWNLDLFDEDYDKQEMEVIGSLPIAQLDNMSDRIPSQKELDAWKGKTGEEMLGAGWSIAGWNLMEKQFFLDHEYFEYMVTMDGDLKLNDDDDIDGEEAFKPLTVKKIEFSHMNNATWDIEPQEEEWIEDEGGEMMTGGWMNEDLFYSMPVYELDPASFEPLTKVTETLMGVDYEPLALLGRQVVAGMNYAYLCKATVVAPNAEPYLVVVFVYQALDGSCEVLNIVPIDVGAGSQEGDISVIAFDPAAAEPTTGSWQVVAINMQAREAGVKLSEKESLQLLQVEIPFTECQTVMEYGHLPMYCLAWQVVSGTNYCFLAVEGENTFVLDYVHEVQGGDTELLTTRLFDYPELVYIGQE